MATLQAHLLIASPMLPDTNFYRSVVLLIHHDEDGAFGVILNRPMQSSVGEIWELITKQTCDNQQPVYLGGPVEGPLMAIHTIAKYAEREILPGVYFATNKAMLSRVVRRVEQPYRLFSGYAGWSGGQLEGELQAGGWLTMPATYEYIFGHHGDDLWKAVTQDIGEEIVRPLLPRTAIPAEPTMN